LPHNSAPYTSTIVLLVRKNNPKKIKDWEDLIRPGIQVITPNPKTSGGARWNYLAAWVYALQDSNGDETYARQFITALFRNVPVLDTGARAATNTFIRGMGDVFISWENEALLAVKKLGQDQYEIIIPSLSILAEPPVAVIDKNAAKHGVRDIAEAYLKFLYTPQGQEICARHFYRPRNQTIAARYSSQFPEIKLFTLNEQFGSWAKAQKIHFSDKGIFDQIFENQ
jgi:sulfate/thiosulfate-binding protein